MANDSLNELLLGESSSNKPARMVKTRPWTTSSQLTSPQLSRSAVFSSIFVAPFFKFIYSTIVLYFLNLYDQLEDDVKQKIKDETSGFKNCEVFLLESLLVISISVISIIMGFVTFKSYPMVDQEALNEYYVCSVVIYIAQLCSTMFVYGTVALVPWQLATAYLVTILDTCFILILRTYVNSPNGILVPTDSPRAVEMRVMGRPAAQEYSVSEV